MFYSRYNITRTIKELVPSKVKKFITIISIFFFFGLPSYSQSEVSWNDLRSEILIHTGFTGFRTQKSAGTRRDNAGQIGYDLKFGLDVKKFRPFLLAHGYWVFNKVHTQIGAGTYYFLNKSEFQFDFSRKREKTLDLNGEYFQGDIVLYKARLLWSYPLWKFESSTLKGILGFGNNTHGEKKLFKFNRGEYYTAGFRLHFDQDRNSNESFLTELYWEQDTIRSSSLKQERNSVIIRIGKRL